MADVERDDAACATLQEHVGESTGRGANVERIPSIGRNVERVERVGEFQTAAPDVRVVGAT